MHNKFIVIDEKRVIAGSPNMSIDADYRNHEFPMVTEDPEVVGPFGQRFEEMWNMAGRKR
ncbi:MAG: hypothetical protein JRJ29_18920 [Deltaproteobacteria bacterium]|nr:hypothetical protein [Deltaproteobacteria bacterium]